MAVLGVDSIQSCFLTLLSDHYYSHDEQLTCIGDGFQLSILHLSINYVVVKDVGFSCQSRRA